MENTKISDLKFTHHIIDMDDRDSNHQYLGRDIETASVDRKVWIITSYDARNFPNMTFKEAKDHIIDNHHLYYDKNSRE